jgi:ribosomal protein S18 acetylase RimI-like enzyme
MVARECRILYPVPGGEIGDDLRRRAQSGRSSLRYFLGDTDRRQRAFVGCVNDDRVIGIMSGDRLVGFASFSLGRRGPLSPSFSQFAAEYGLVGALRNLLIFRLTEPWVGSSSLYVYNVQVDKELRGRGIGVALMDAIEGVARTLGCRSITLQVTAHNKAILLYLKKGFTVTGTVKPGRMKRFFPFRCLVNMKRLLPVPKAGRVPQPAQRPPAITGNLEAVPPR